MNWISVIAALAFLLMAWWLVRRRIQNFIQTQMGDYSRLRAEEETTREEAPWFGATGLTDDEERELPRYLRREFGEFWQSPGGLQARELVYLGIQTDEEGKAHFWRIPRRLGDDDSERYFAYIDLDEFNRAVCYGWGGRTPPQQGPNTSQMPD